MRADCSFRARRPSNSACFDANRAWLADDMDWPLYMDDADDVADCGYID